jgi:hypothetical protein
LDIMVGTNTRHSSMPKPRILHPLMSWSIIKTEILNMSYLSILQMRMLIPSFQITICQMADQYWRCEYAS